MQCTPKSVQLLTRFCVGKLPPPVDRTRTGYMHNNPLVEYLERKQHSRYSEDKCEWREHPENSCNGYRERQVVIRFVVIVRHLTLYLMKKDGETDEWTNRQVYS